MSPIGPLNLKGYTLSNLILTEPRKHKGHPVVQPDIKFIIAVYMIKLGDITQK